VVAAADPSSDSSSSSSSSSINSGSIIRNAAPDNAGETGAGDSSSSSLAHLTCVLSDGRRVFLGTRIPASGSASSIAAPASATAGASRSDGSASVSLHMTPNLLSTSMHDLIEEARVLQVSCETHKLRRRAFEENRRAQASALAAQFEDDDFHASSNKQYLQQQSQLRDADDQLDTMRGTQAETDLWVNKHSPRNFSQLLSFERTNRDVLKALKQWDKYVYRNTDTGTGTGHGTGTGANSNSGTAGSSGAEGGFSSSAKPGAGTAADATQKPRSSNNNGNGNDDQRPEQKVILLCGPPGTGKTTLAYIVAKHCGYRPFEINASDDRTADVLKDNISRAMHGNTLTRDRRPNCIILDEIDGIDSKASIDALIKIIQQPLRRKKSNSSAKGEEKENDAAEEENGEGEEDGEKASKKTAPGSTVGGRRTHGLALTRPLICICNDQYAPVLRDLRKHCLMFVFQPPQEKRLISRLQAICVTEHLSVNSSALASLVNASAGDIRSSVNTLQFAALRIQSTTENAGSDSQSAASAASGTDFASVLSSMISHGLKDENRDVFQVWREAFSQSAVSQSIARQRGNTTKVIAGATLMTKNTAPVILRGPLMQATQTMADYGDSQLILRGLFHNVLKMRYNDPSMSRSSLASDWLSSSELLESRCFGGSNDGFALMAYVPSVAGALHMLCANDTRVKIEWPTVDRDQHYKQQQNANILQSLQVGTGAGAGAASSDSDSSSGGITLALSTLSPSLRCKSAVACDVISHLIDIISPRVRPVAFITLGLTEQDAVMKAVHVMASTGLSYHMQRAYAPSFNNQSNGQNTGFGQPKPYVNQQPQQQQQQTIQLVLEPAIDQLLKYSNIADTALVNRHWRVPYESRNNIFMELKKYLIQLHAGVTVSSRNDNSTQLATASSTHANVTSTGSPRKAARTADTAAASATATVTATATATTPVRRGRSNSLTDREKSRERESGQKRAFVVASPQATMLARKSDTGEKKPRLVSPLKVSKHANPAAGSVDTAADFLTGGMSATANANATANTNATEIVGHVAATSKGGKATIRSIAFFKGGNFVQEKDRLADQRLIEREHIQANPKNSNNDKKGRGDGNGVNGSNQSALNALRFKFNQGFSNAVRRPVSVSDFA